MEYYLEKYKDYLENKRTSPNTVKAYTNDINELYIYIKGKNKDIKDFKDMDFKIYINYINDKEYKSGTNARKIISLRNFFKFLYKFNYLDFNPTLREEIPRIKRKTPVILEIEEVNKLINSIDTNSVKGIRDKAIIEVMYGCGLKANETVNLKQSNANLKMEYIICMDSKGNERIIPLGEKAVQALWNYLQVRDKIKKETDFLFLNIMGGKLSRQGLWKMLKERAKTAGIDKNMDLNTLRHSFAYHLLLNGADIKSIQELLGHKELTTTLMYVNIKRRDKLREVYKRAHPRA